MAKDELRVVVVAKDSTDPEIIDIMDGLESMVKAMTPDDNFKGFHLLIDGFDDDPREMWDIPAAQKLCQRLWLLGFGSPLKASTFLVPSDDDEPKGAFGAFEVWLTSQGKLTSPLEVDAALWQRFTRELNRSNKRCEANLAAKRNRSN